MEIGQRIYGAYGGYLGLTEDKNSSKTQRNWAKNTLLSRILRLFCRKSRSIWPNRFSKCDWPIFGDEILKSEVWKNQKGGPKGSFLTVFLDLRLYLYKKFYIKVVVCVCDDTSHNTMEPESPKNGSFPEIGNFLSFWKNPKILLFFAGCPQCLGRVRLSLFLPSAGEALRRAKRGAEKIWEIWGPKVPFGLFCGVLFFGKMGLLFIK